MMKFEIGKTYVCANAALVTVKQWRDYKQQFVAVSEGSMEAISLVYNVDGRPSGTGFEQWTIIKEWVRDETVVAESKATTIKTSPSCGGDDRIQLLFDGLARVEQRLAKMDEEAALNLVATDARLDRLSGIINEYEGNFGRLGDRCTNLGHKADGAHTRIGALSARLDRYEAKLDIMEGLPNEAADIRSRLAVLASMAKVLES